MQAGEAAVEVVQGFLVVIGAIEVRRKIEVSPIVQIVQADGEIQVLLYLTEALLAVLAIEQAGCEVYVTFREASIVHLLILWVQANRTSLLDSVDQLVHDDLGFVVFL